MATSKQRQGIHFMRRCAWAAVLTLASGLSYAGPADEGLPLVSLQTEYGRIVVQVDTDRAPVTAANFLRHVEGGHYDGGSFYRTVTLANDNGSPRIEVIQGGRGNDAATVFEPIAHESTADTGMAHTDGVISMARGAAGTASSEFFICIGDQPGLDHGAERYDDRMGFAAFGRVVIGMEVVRRIHQAPSDAPTDQAYVTGQILEAPVAITGARRLQGAGLAGPD